jgi:hypothetical protein
LDQLDEGGEMQEAEARGAEAFRAGKALNENPGRSLLQKFGWETGWRRAKSLTASEPPKGSAYCGRCRRVQKLDHVCF